MTAIERIEPSNDREDEIAPISEREQTAALRREVGRCTRASWDALQRTIASFARSKVGATDGLLGETGHACDVALAELERLEHALRSLRAELACVQRDSFRDPLVDERPSHHAP